MGNFIVFNVKPFLIIINEHSNIYCLDTPYFHIFMIIIHRGQHFNEESLKIDIAIFLIFNCRNGNTAMFYMETRIEKDRQFHKRVSMLNGLVGK